MPGLAPVSVLSRRCKYELMQMPVEKGHWRLQPRPNQPSGKTCPDHNHQVASWTLWPASTPEAIGIMDSALCDCTEAEQTVYHILEDCSIWRHQTHQLWPQEESTTNKLWGTAEDLRRTTLFLATCGLRV